MPPNETGPDTRVCNVSGSNRAATAPETTEKTTSKIKIARQPNAVCNKPPIIGATIGANAVTDPISDNSRPARAPE